MRHRDIHLLTVGKYTYTSDQRFRGLHEEDSDDWVLKIDYVQVRFIILNLLQTKMAIIFLNIWY